MSQTSWLRWPITRVIWRRNSFSRFAGTCPSTRTSPEVGCSRPESILSVVVLPAPLGPRNPTISPGASSKRDAVDGADLAGPSLEEALEGREGAGRPLVHHVRLAQIPDLDGGLAAHAETIGGAGAGRKPGGVLPRKPVQGFRSAVSAEAAVNQALVLNRFIRSCGSCGYRYRPHRDWYRRS